MKVLEVRGLRYNNILKGVSFHVKRGEWLVILGPNGAGKTTLLKLLSGEKRAEGGEVKVWGKESKQYKRKEFARFIGFMFTDFEPMVKMRVKNYISLGLYPYQDFFGRVKPVHKKNLELAIEITQIEDLLERKLNELSSGELQRVRIARLVVQNPEIFVFDEPLAHLDIRHKLWFLDFVARLRAGGKTVITVIHDFLLLQYYNPDTFLILNQGTVIFNGSREDHNFYTLLSKAFGIKFKADSRGFSIELQKH